MLYDCIVIGKGLIGSAAARYLSQSQKNVAVIGPDEPPEVSYGTVFSSHYDQSRIQRIIGVDPVWTLLNLQSAGEYDFLRRESNIEFHSGVGCLYVSPSGSDAYLDRIESQEKEFNIKFKLLENAEKIQAAFPDFKFPASSKGIFESSPSGHINPILLINAQLTLLKKNKGHIFDDIAGELHQTKNYIEVTTLKNDIYKAKKILLCSGAFTNSFNLIQNKLALTLKSETTVLAKVTADEAQRLSNLPSLLYEIQNAEYQNIYLIRPIRYADGYYLKMGCNLPGDIYFDNIKDISDWFKSGNSDADLKILSEALMTIIPTLKVESFFTKRCIVTYTKHRKPYIGPINNNGLFVATGGNGYGAMCSDAIGRIASHLLINNVFPKEYLGETFEPLFL